MDALGVTPAPEVVTTTYGGRSLEVLARVVAAAKQDDPLAPVTVVMPSNHVGVTARRALASGRLGPITPRGTGVVGVSFLTPYRLAELLGAPRLAASGRRPVSTPVVAAALRQALREAAGVFAPVAEHPATEEALVTAYHELADLSDAAIDRLAGASPRARDVVDVCRRARRRLRDDWYDEADLVAAACAQLDDPAAGASILLRGHLVVHLPQDLTRGAATLLRAAAHLCSTTVVVGLAGDERADLGVRRCVSRLGLEVPDSETEHWPVSAASTRVLTTSDADEEVRAAVRAVVDACRQGVPLERMAILYPVDQPYLRLLHEQLSAAAITANGLAAQALRGCALGRTLLGLLALREHGYRRRDVLGLLTDAPLRRVEASDGRRPWRSAEWERMSREAAVVAGRADWDLRLSRLADEVEQRAADVDEVDEERREARVERLVARAERTRELRDLVLGLIDELEHAAGATVSWRERVRWLRRLASRLVGGEAARQSWPAPERKAAERIDAALDRLVGLDEVDGPAGFDVFRRTLELELDADLGRVGRLGEGVLVAPLSFAIGLDLDLVIVVGMAEGTLPAPLTDDSLLPDRERQRTDGELPLRRELVDRQRRQLVAALAASGRHVLCAPRGDLRASNERTMSRWLGEIVDELGASVVDQVASFAHAVATVGFPTTAQEYRLRLPRRTAIDDAVVSAGRALQEARRSPAFTRYDGNLAGQLIRSPVDDVVSATRLESWAVCPHAYFVRHVLGVEATDDPAEQLWISPLDRGSLVHEVLEGFLRAVLGRPGDVQPDPETAWSDEDRDLMHSVAHGLFADYEARGIVGRRVFWERDRTRILLRLDRFLDEESVRRRMTNSRPVAAELAFGLPSSELPPVEVPVSGGRRLQFRGAADRIDIAAAGTLRVIDYKTGRPDDYRALSPDSPDDRGTHLQLPVYGLAARAALERPTAPVVAEYWFITDRDDLTSIGYAVTDQVLTRVGETLGVVVDGIERGIFPARPPTTSSTDPFVRCRYCDPDGLGVTERRRDWERKRSDPAVAVYANLAEPPDPQAESDAEVSA